jgi:hypothetical protein
MDPTEIAVTSALGSLMLGVISMFAIFGSRLTKTETQIQNHDDLIEEMKADIKSALNSAESVKFSSENANRKLDILLARST